MDPNQTLRDVRAALDARNLREAGKRLSDYWDWRHKGGFEPMDGDFRAKAYRLSILNGGT